MTVGAAVIEYALNIARAGGAAALALSFGTTEVAANRVGLFADLTGAAEKLTMVVGGVTGPSFNRSGTDVLVNFPAVLPASSSTVGAFTFGNGTAATNVAIGGGNINAGGTLTVGGATTINSTAAQLILNATSGAVNLNMNLAGASKMTLACISGAIPYGLYDQVNTWYPQQYNAGAVSAGFVTFNGTLSASASNAGAVVIGNGVAATSIGLGGGNINAGNAITCGTVMTAVGGITITGAGVAATTAVNFMVIRTGHTTGSNGFAFNNSAGSDNAIMGQQGSSTGALNWNIADTTYLYAPNRFRVASGVIANNYFEVTGTAVALGSGTTLTVNNTTASTATTTAAVVVTGGIGAGDGLTIGQAVKTTGSPYLATFTGAAHTTLTLSVEASDVVLNLGRIVQFATGALTTQRAVRIAAPTYAFVGASTITNAATFAISGSPITGTNATLTNSWALWVQSGTSRFDAGTITTAQPIIDGTATWNAGGVAFAGIRQNITDTASTAGSLLIDLQLGGVSRFNVDKFGNTIVAQGVITTGSPALLTLTGAAHTTLTLSVEASDIVANLARTVQFATGAIATQRAFRVMAPTYGFVGASTITTAATFAISGAPIVGTNATITTPLSLWSQSGAVQFDQGTVAVAVPPILNLSSTWNAAGVTFTGLRINVTATASAVASLLLDVQSFGVSRFNVDASGNTTIAQNTYGAGTPPNTLLVTPSNNSGLTLSVEATDIRFNLNRTVQWATGALATQRAVRVGAPIYAFVGASTITNAATFAIEGAPGVGTNATLTNSWALWVQAGSSMFAGTTDATSATTGNVQNSGGENIAKNLLHRQGRGAGFTTTVTAASTTTLTTASTEVQAFTGSTAGKVVQFPAANAFGANISVLYTINNQSSVTVTPTRAGADTFQGGGTTDPVIAGATTRYASDGVSVWMKI